MGEALSCWFFMSYAWADNPDNDPQASSVAAFHAKVEAAIASKVNEGLDRYGFLDRKAIENGDDWKRELIRALRGCRAFVPLLTSRYPTSSNCGREWTAFEARQNGQNVRLIQPIYWDARHRVSNKLLGEELQLGFSEQDFGPDLQHFRQYQRLGMSALVQRMKSDASADTTVTVMANALAEVIVDRWTKTPLPVAPPTLFGDWDKIVPKFPPGITLQVATDAPVLARVHFAVAAATANEMLSKRGGALRYYPAAEREWIPYAESSATSASQLALEASLELELQCRWLDAKAPLVKEIRALERNGNEPVIILVDPWSLQVSALRKNLIEYDESRFANSVLIVAWNASEREQSGFKSNDQRTAQLESDVRAVFARSYPGSGESADFNAKVVDIDTLRAALVRAVTTMRGLSALERKPLRIVESAEPLPLNRNQS